MPSLCERQADLRALTLHCLKRASRELRKEVLGISEEAMGWLERYPWPGNVRELAAVIEQAVARCQGPTVTVQDLPQRLWEPSRVPGSSGEAITRPPGDIALADLERQLRQQALEQAHWNTSQAAKLLGLSRTQLRAWNGNVETWRDVFVGKDSVLVHAILAHFRHRWTFPTRPDAQKIVRLRTPSEVDRWLSSTFSTDGAPSALPDNLATEEEGAG